MLTRRAARQGGSAVAPGIMMPVSFATCLPPGAIRAPSVYPHGLAGLFFCPVPRSHAVMDKDIERIILRTLEDAREKGRDYITQTQLAVHAVCEARPDMTASDALAAVNLVRRS